LSRPRADHLPGSVLEGAELVDHLERWSTGESTVPFDSGRVISVRTDRVESADGSTFHRDVVVHPGAVGIIALDGDDRMLLVSQYRHPVGHRLLEPPAGLLDIPGEPAHRAAARELAEEGQVRADDWRILVDPFTSPGMTDEAIRIYLARGLHAIPVEERHVGTHEEADMPVCWARLTDVVSHILSGGLHNPILVMGALACQVAAVSGGWDRLRPADTAWRAREDLGKR
jgi:8-oxo-dGTP pyrophosphatase MutT (NUDIX family)